MNQPNESTGPSGVRAVPERARVVIIGGGAVGASVLYHLAERGMSDAVLLDMNELTSGSTWHAAGNIPTFSSDRSMLRLQKYSTELYTRLFEDPAYPFAYHRTGALRLARTEARALEFERVTAMANAMDYGYELMSPQDMAERYPEVSAHDVRSVLWDPNDGDMDPSQLTQALAAHARAKGARVVRFSPVTAIESLPDRRWRVVSDKGAIECDIVVNAAGYRGAEVAALAGEFLPMVAMEHQYLVTESVPELEARSEKLPLVRDPDASYYLRQEKHGLILGPYEEGATPRWTDGALPDDFAYQLWPDDLDRLEWYIEQACERVPLLGTVGVQRVINGPIPYAPDGFPYVGPAVGKPNFFHACAFTFGICQAGGAGRAISEYILDGRPSHDLWSLDPRRYDDYADQGYVVEKACEVYADEYGIQYPEEEKPAGRPRLTTPVTERLAAHGAVFGARGGWERAVWFAREGEDRDAKPGFDRTGWHDAVTRECLAVRDGCGLLEVNGFSRQHVHGAGARDWLDGLVCTRLPREGRLGLAWFCDADGHIVTETTIAALGDDDFLLIGAAAARRLDRDWLNAHRPDGSAIAIDDRTRERTALVLAGPQARDVLQPLTETDLSNAGFPWLSARTLVVAGIEVLAMRVNYVGELGWELHVPIEHAAALYDALQGSAPSPTDVGMYAMESLRIEKAYRAWKVDIDRDVTPLHAGFGRFVALDKGDFIGREALKDIARAGPERVFVQLLLDGESRLPMFGAPVHDGDRVVGMLTSATQGRRLDRDVALGYVDAASAAPGTDVEIDVFGARRRATVVAEPAWDPDNVRPRG